jgi:hypothetical protein
MCPHIGYQLNPVIHLTDVFDPQRSRPVERSPQRATLQGEQLPRNFPVG